MSWAVVLLIVGIVVYMTTRLRTHRGSIGPGASGAVYDMLNEDKRKAIEIIVEGRAECRDPEDADGNLPDLEDPKAAGRGPRTHGPIR